MSLFRAARHSLRLILSAVILAISTALLAQSPESVAYSVDLSSPEQHLVEVQIILPPGAAQRDLQLPVWNALYQVRDFAQYVNWVHARDRWGKPLPVRELDKSRWQIQGAEAGAIIYYQVHLDSPGPFVAQLNTHHAFLNLAPIL